MGFYLRVLQAGGAGDERHRVGLLSGRDRARGVFDNSTWPRRSPSRPRPWSSLVVYGFAASVLPVWMLRPPRLPRRPSMKVGTISLLAVGILFTMPVLQNEAVTKFASSGKGPVFAGPLFPFVFIIIACGALSGFHALIASGTTPKLIEKESQVRMVGYGAMLTESFVAVMAMIAASILDQGLTSHDLAQGVVGRPSSRPPRRVTNLGFHHHPRPLHPRPRSRSRPCSLAPGAPPPWRGRSTIFSGAVRRDALKAFCNHFAICSRPCSS